jgi:sec-independent protein translocase protein TatA
LPPHINLISLPVSFFVTLTAKTFFMGSFGFQEFLVIGIVVLILFGGKKIPEFMRGLGKGIREFNDAKNNVKREIEEGIKEKDNSTTGA